MHRIAERGEVAAQLCECGARVVNLADARGVLDGEGGGPQGVAADRRGRGVAQDIADQILRQQHVESARLVDDRRRGGVSVLSISRTTACFRTYWTSLRPSAAA